MNREDLQALSSRDLKLMTKDGYSYHVGCIRPKSRGTVRLASANEELFPGAHVQSDEDLAQAIKDKFGLEYHPVGILIRNRPVLKAVAF